MKQVFRKGLKHIVVAEAPAPMVVANHVLVNPVYSLISSGTEGASIHDESIIKEVTHNPSQLRKVWDGMKAMGVGPTIAEVRAKFHEYAALGYAGASSHDESIIKEVTHTPSQLRKVWDGMKAMGVVSDFLDDAFIVN